METADEESKNQPRRKPRHGDLFEVEVESFDGKGRARGIGTSRELPESGPWRAILRGAAPGERVLAQVIRRRRSEVECRLLETLRPAPHAVEPRCAYFGTCGGCSFQHVSYEAQNEHKREAVEGILAKRDLLSGVEVESAAACAEPWNYRNKMEFTFSNRRWIEESEPESADSSFALGLHVPARYDKVIDIARCEIQSELANRILTSARRMALEQGLVPWDVRAHTGLLRHIVLRVAESTSEIMVNLVTSEDATELVARYSQALLSEHPEITTLVQNVNTRPAAIAVGEWEHVLHGPGVIREEIDGLSFLISAASFFQTNSRQAEELFRIVRKEAACSVEDHVFDVYCGTGSIALNLARDAGSVVGFELVEEAVVDARRNAELNSIANVSFVGGDVSATIEAHLQTHPKPSLIVVDPPRAGIHQRVLRHLAEVKARRIIYVSCNPESGAVDASGLAMYGYRVTRVQPVDLFPHTPHVETVLTLELSE